VPLSLGDIGPPFPPEDPSLESGPDSLLAARAGERPGAPARRLQLVNVGHGVVAERPEASSPTSSDAVPPIARGVLGVAPEQVGVKATTTEGLGRQSPGGIACHGRPPFCSNQ